MSGQRDLKMPMTCYNERAADLVKLPD